jgi:hypothetical protein
MPSLEERLKIANEHVANVKPDLLDNKSSGNQIKPKSDRLWDQKYQPLIDANKGFERFQFEPDKSGKKIDGWDDIINYGNSLPIMKAVNGRYDAYLKKGDLNSEAKELINTLKNSSFAAMNELEKISNGGGSMETFLKYQKNALVADYKLGKTIGPGSKSNYIYDPDKKTLSDRVTFEKNNNTVKVGDRGSTETNVGEGKVNPYQGYIQTKGYLNLSMESVKNQVKPLVKAWGDNAYNYFNADDKAAGRIDSKNRDNTLNFSKDALTFISKYGTQSGNPVYDKENKKKAAVILNKLNAFGKNEDPRVARDEQIKYIKQLTTGKTNQLTNMVEDMGYYGSVFLYKKYKDVLGSNDKYYQGAEKYLGKTDELDEEIDSHETYAKGIKEDKLEARTEAMKPMDMPHKQMFFKNIISDNGNIQSYHQFLKNAGYDPKTGSLGKNSRDPRTGIVIPPELYRAYDDLNSYWTGTTGGTTSRVNPNEVNYFGGKDGKEYKSYGTTFAIGNKGAFDKIMRQAYNETVKAYKKRFSDLNDPKKREKDLGRGSTADKVFYYDYVDMSLDKNGFLVNTSGDKHKNVSTIFDMMKNADGTINTRNVTLLSNEELKRGTYSKASKATLDKEYLLDQNPDKFNNFFKGKDLSQMYVEFDRHSSVPYRSTYTFVNMKTGEKLAMIAPVDHIKKHKEYIHAKTWMTVPEARFQRLGQLKLPDSDGYYKNAAIIQKDGQKLAVFQYKDDDGVLKREQLELGDVQIETAKQTFLDFFKRIKELDKEYSLK